VMTPGIALQRLEFTVNALRSDVAFAGSHD
jgi:hypothetical protein